MHETLTSGWTKSALASLFLIVASLVLAGPAYSHAEHVGQEQPLADALGLDQDHDEERIAGHCHGGPSCTNALFGSECIGPESIRALSRAAYHFSDGTFAGMPPEHDPPIPILLL